MSDPRPIRTVLVIFLIGTGVALAALAWYANVATDIARPQPAEAAPSALPPPARALYGWLLISSALVLVFLFGAVVIVRWGRQHRARLGRSRRQPTKTEDVWQMHRLPED